LYECNISCSQGQDSKNSWKAKTAELHCPVELLIELNMREIAARILSLLQAAQKRSKLSISRMSNKDLGSKTVVSSITGRVSKYAAIRSDRGIPLNAGQMDCLKTGVEYINLAA